jgi:hypothetical protein
MFKFERLTVWQKAVDPYAAVGLVTDALPARAVQPGRPTAAGGTVGQREHRGGDGPGRGARGETFLQHREGIGL